ncbi:MAG: sugar-binding transcriptional regulator [Chloroflexota bacterium]
MDQDHLTFLAQIAAWYYEENLPQNEIAQRIGRSRSMVSRLLQEARDQGLVEIRVRHPMKRDASMEARLQETFGLQQVRVLAQPPADYELMLQRLGALGAQQLQEYLDDSMCVGLSWGTAVHAVVEAMPDTPLQNATVVQIIGALGYGDPMVDGPELARWLAQKLSASYRYLHAPLIVQDEALARSLKQERSIAATLQRAGAVDVALVGIGSLDVATSSLQRAGYLDESTLRALQARGARGDILARPIDAAGRPLDLDLARRTIGLDLETLRAIPAVIAVAGGAAKAPAILAALRGRYPDVLVTDATTATTVIEMEEEKHYAG